MYLYKITELNNECIYVDKSPPHSKEDYIRIVPNPTTIKIDSISYQFESFAIFTNIKIDQNIFLSLHKIDYNFKFTEIPETIPSIFSNNSEESLLLIRLEYLQEILFHKILTVPEDSFKQIYNPSNEIKLFYIPLFKKENSYISLEKTIFILENKPLAILNKYKTLFENKKIDQQQEGQNNRPEINLKLKEEIYNSILIKKDSLSYYRLDGVALRSELHAFSYLFDYLDIDMRFVATSSANNSADSVHYIFSPNLIDDDWYHHKKNENNDWNYPSVGDSDLFAFTHLKGDIFSFLIICLNLTPKIVHTMVMLSHLQQAIDYKFNNTEFLSTALTTSSHSNELDAVFLKPHPLFVRRLGTYKLPGVYTKSANNFINDIYFLFYRDKVNKSTYIDPTIGASLYKYFVTSLLFNIRPALTEKKINEMTNNFMNGDFILDMLRSLSKNKLDALSLEDLKEVHLSTDRAFSWAYLMLNKTIYNTCHLSDKMVVASFYSVLAAVFIDSSCNFSEVRKTLYKLLFSGNDSLNEFYLKENLYNEEHEKDIIVDNFLENWKETFDPVFKLLKDNFKGFVESEYLISRALMTRSHISVLGRNTVSNSKYVYLDNSRLKALGMSFYSLCYDLFFYFAFYVEEIVSNKFDVDHIVPIVDGLGIGNIIVKVLESILMKGEESAKDQTNRYKRDVFFSLLGANIVESGAGKAYKHLYNIFIDMAKNNQERYYNPKSMVNNNIQYMIKEGYRINLAEWETVFKDRVEQNDIYECNVTINRHHFGRGKGISKMIAERLAAEEVLVKMEGNEFKDKFELINK